MSGSGDENAKDGNASAGGTKAFADKISNNDGGGGAKDSLDQKNAEASRSAIGDAPSSSNNSSNSRNDNSSNSNASSIPTANAAPPTKV